MKDLSLPKRIPFNFVRVVLGGLCFALSLLVIVPTPTSALWKPTIIVTEWGYWLIPVALLPLWPGWRPSWHGRIGALLGLCAMLLFLSPLFLAIPTSHKIRVELENTFGETESVSRLHAPARPAPLVLGDLFRGVHSPDVSISRQTYVKNKSYELVVDLYHPPHQEGLAPVVLVIHGGSWSSGDATQLTDLNSYLAARGYVVAAINYRLAPKWPFPAALEDVHAAITFLTENATTLRLDTQRLVLVGRSAGGQLALLAGYTAEEDSIRGVVAFYSPADLEYAYANPSNPAVLDTKEILEDYLGGSPNQIRAIYKAGSPIQFVKPTSPPTLLIHGERDELVSPVQSKRLSHHLGQQGVPHVYLRFPWATHGCDANFNGPCGQISTFAIERFLTAVMK